jgi:hypothetical protein
VNRMRERYGFRGTPLRLVLRAKDGEGAAPRQAARGSAKAKRKARKFA